jgi:hypothetical protein
MFRGSDFPKSMLTIYPHRLSRLTDLIQDPDRSRVWVRLQRGLTQADQSKYDRARWFFDRALEICTTERETDIVTTAIEFVDLITSSPEADRLAIAVQKFSVIRQYFAGA